MIHTLARTMTKTFGTTTAALPTPRRLRGMSTMAVERVVDVDTLIKRVTPVFLPTSQAASVVLPFLIPKEAKEHMAAQLPEQWQQDREERDHQQQQQPSSSSMLLHDTSTDRGMSTLLDTLDKYDHVAVTVEMGDHYMSENMVQTEVPLPYFSAYLRLLEEEEEKMDEKAEVDEVAATPIVYLAQQTLGDAVVELQQHPMPLVLQVMGMAQQKRSKKEQTSLLFDVYSRVSWMGPSRTFSPFHVDPHYNCFEQHRGSKVFRLVSEEESKHLPRSEDVLQQNTLAVDGGGGGATVLEVVVEEGDELFLPMRWMHEVRSLPEVGGGGRRNTSISTTTWWRPSV